MTEEKLYVGWKRRELGKKIICKGCSKEIITSKHREHCGYCQSCNCKRLSEKTGISDDELFLIEAGAKRRAKKIFCASCNKELIVRKNSKQGYCRPCNAKMAVKRGQMCESPLKNIRGYRKKAFKNFKKACACCDTSKMVDVHHIDQNKKNNEIFNLLPLCKKCHIAIHRMLRNGSSHDEAFENIRKKHRRDNGSKRHNSLCI